MNEKLLNELTDLFEQDKHNMIVEVLTQIPEENLDFDLTNHLGRAYNNIEEYEKALKTLYTVSEKGKKDALWNFRVGYAYFYKNENEKALPYFEKSAELGDKTAINFIRMTKGKLNIPQDKNIFIDNVKVSKIQVELQVKMLNQTKTEFEQNIKKLKNEFPFDYWHNTLLKEFGMEQYTLENCKKGEGIMSNLIIDLIKIGLKANESSKLEKFKKATIAYNTLNDDCDGALIETDEREKLCELIDKIGIICGLIPDKYGDGDGIASEWRDW